MKKIVSLIGAAMLCAACVFPISGMKGINVNGGKKVTCRGPVTTKTFDLTGFEAITVNGSADMELFQGDQFQVLVKANEEVFDYLDYKVEDGVLVIETKNHVNIRAEEYDITITIPLLKELTVNGAGDVQVSGKAGKARLKVSGAGDIDVSRLECSDIDTHKSGIASIKLPK